MDFGFPAMLSLLFLQPEGIAELLTICLLHELGHGLAMALSGAGLKEIRFYSVGIQMRTNTVLLQTWQLLCIYLSGPAVNLLFAYWLRGTEIGLLHLAMGCFNLLPFRTLDGGTAIRCILGMHDNLCRLLTIFCELLALGMILLLMWYEIRNPSLYMMVIYLAIAELVDKPL
ncbi:MAG TPA: hypothetical protein DCO72_04235 [Ruminococcus sp.]|nr:hypothetical protein [Ruminococcus sp.]